MIRYYIVVDDNTKNYNTVRTSQEVAKLTEWNGATTQFLKMNENDVWKFNHYTVTCIEIPDIGEGWWRNE